MPTQSPWMSALMFVGPLLMNSMMMLPMMMGGPMMGSMMGPMMTMGGMGMLNAFNMMISMMMMSAPSTPQPQFGGQFPQPSQAQPQGAPPQGAPPQGFPPPPPGTTFADDADRQAAPSKDAAAEAPRPEDAKSAEPAKKSSSAHRPSATKLMKSKPPKALSSSQSAALNKLSPQDKDDFEALWKLYENEALKLSGKDEDHSIQDELAQLLEGDRLGNKDIHDGSLVSNIRQIAEGQCADGLDARSLAAQVIHETANPAKAVVQGNRKSDLLGIAEYSMAGTDPSELSRIIRGLATPDGSVVLKGGKTAHRVADSIDEDLSGRSDVSRLLQSSMMDLGAKIGNLGDYSNVKDGYEGQGGRFIPASQVPIELISAGLNA